MSLEATPSDTLPAAPPAPPRPRHRPSAAPAPAAPTLAARFARLGRPLRLAFAASVALGLVLAAAVAHAEGMSVAIDGGSGPSGAAALRIVALMTLLSVAPALLLSLTCFTRFLIVFAFLRTAIGVQGAPPNQVLTGLALFLTFFAMAPVGERVYADSLRPYLDGQLTEAEALDAAAPPLRNFMLRATREQDIGLFADLAGLPALANASSVPMRVLIPAFVTSELQTSFEMGVLVLIPFVLVDLIVASVLMSLGMMMLPPAVVALPLKVILFVLVDGWTLIVSSLARSVLG